MIPNVVILGAGRSGTSILSELFEYAPGYRYYFEPAMPWLREMDFSRGPFAVKMPVDFDATRYTPGLAFDLEELLGIMPDSTRWLWVVRHPLDAVCSMRRGVTGAWSHPPAPPDAPAGLPPVLRAAHYWKWTNGTGREALRSAVDLLTVRYEDLVARPTDTALSVIAHVGIAGVDVDAFASTVSNETGGYEAMHQVRWKTNDHACRVGRWRENLTDQEVSDVWGVVGEVAAQFGYGPDGFIERGIDVHAAGL